jgi:mannose/fructose/N-acetylgalactosamine-specific phosphotransferase system component IID
LVKKEKAAQKTFNEERQQHMGQAQATKPQLKRAEREARQLLEKQRMEANQLVSNAT